MSNLVTQPPRHLRLDVAGAFRLPPLPPMQLGLLTKGALIGIRVLLGVTTAMATYAAFHGLPA